MNRAQKRQIVQTNQRLYTEDEVRYKIAYTKERMLNKLANDYSTVMMYTLRHKWGFGHIRAKRFIENINETFDHLKAERVTINDLKQTINDEIGVVIE